MKGNRLKIGAILLIGSTAWLILSVLMLTKDTRPFTIASVAEASLMFAATVFFFFYNLKKNK